MQNLSFHSHFHLHSLYLKPLLIYLFIYFFVFYWNYYCDERIYWYLVYFALADKNIKPT